MGLVILKDSSTSGLPTYTFRYLMITDQISCTSLPKNAKAKYSVLKRKSYFRYQTGSASVVIFSFALTIFFIYKNNIERN